MTKKAMASQLAVSKYTEIAAMATASAAGDEAAQQMLEDMLKERFPVQHAEFGTFLNNGRPYMVRTVSDHFTGLVLAQTASEILLGDAAWIPDMGRFMNALQNDTTEDRDTGFREVEPVPDGEVVVMRQSLVSYLGLSVKLPRVQK